MSTVNTILYKRNFVSTILHRISHTSRNIICLPHFSFSQYHTTLIYIQRPKYFIYTEITYLMFIGPCIIVIVEEWKTNLMSLAVLFHFLCVQHVSDINISIIRNLRLFWWITTSVVLFSVRCVLDLWCGWFSVVFVLQAEACKTSTTVASSWWWIY